MQTAVELVVELEALSRRLFKEYSPDCPEPQWSNIFKPIEGPKSLGLSELGAFRASCSGLWRELHGMVGTDELWSLLSMETELERLIGNCNVFYERLDAYLDTLTFELFKALKLSRADYETGLRLSSILGDKLTLLTAAQDDYLCYGPSEARANELVERFEEVLTVLTVSATFVPDYGVGSVEVLSLLKDQLSELQVIALIVH